MSMEKYGSGTLVHCSRDEEGLVEVIDKRGIRALHFGSTARQSAISLVEPYRLELSYVRAMLAGLVITGDPRRVLLLGLGGGTLATFLLHSFQECRIDAVESRDLVVTVARRFFGLPVDPRLAIHVADAADFTRNAAILNAMVYDYILVDLFDGEGMAAITTLPEFIVALGKLLSSKGILAINLWSNQLNPCRALLRQLKLTFSGNVLTLRVVDRGNIIAFGMGCGLPPFLRRSLVLPAKLLEQRLSIEFQRFLHLLTPLGTREHISPSV